MELSRFGKLAIGLYLLGIPAWGGDFFGPAQAVHGLLEIPGGRSLGNVYAASASVVFKAPARVGGNLYAVGREVCVFSRIGGNAHLAGQDVLVQGAVGGDVLVVGNHLEFQPLHAIGGDLLAAGMDVDVQGPVRGQACIVGNQITLNSLIQGRAIVRYDDRLLLGSGCRIKGKLICYGPRPPQVDAGAQVLNIDYRPKDSLEMGMARLSRWRAAFGLVALFRLAAWLIAAWLLLKIFPKPLAEILGCLKAKPAKNLVLGLGLFLAGLVGVPLAFFSLIGFYIALLGTALFWTALLLARLLAVFYLAFLLQRFLEGKKEPSLSFTWAAVSILLLHCVGGIPWVGWLITAGLVFATFGGLARWGNRVFRGTVSI